MTVRHLKWSPVMSTSWYSCSWLLNTHALSIGGIYDLLFTNRRWTKKKQKQKQHLTSVIMSQKVVTSVLLAHFITFLAYMVDEANCYVGEAHMTINYRKLWPTAIGRTEVLSQTPLRNWMLSTTTKLEIGSSSSGAIGWNCKLWLIPWLQISDRLKQRIHLSHAWILESQKLWNNKCVILSH